MSNNHTAIRSASVSTTVASNGKSSHASNGSGHAGDNFAGKHRLSDKLGLDEASLARRREFIRLGDAERELLIGLIPWSAKVAAPLVKEFYAWQYDFAPTRTFFEQYAALRKTPLEALRRGLEASQNGYYRELFEGARNRWSGDYFEQRPHVGWLHARSICRSSGISAHTPSCSV